MGRNEAEGGCSARLHQFTVCGRLAFSEGTGHRGRVLSGRGVSPDFKASLQLPYGGLERVTLGAGSLGSRLGQGPGQERTGLDQGSGRGRGGEGGWQKAKGQ